LSVTPSWRLQIRNGFRELNFDLNPAWLTGIKTPMKTNRVLWVLLLINLGVLTLQIVRAQSNDSQSSAPVLRCRALELVDDQGRVRVELKITPAQPDIKMPDGTVGYPETVLLRLISSNGSPHVKISASEDGAGVVLGGDGGHVQILSRGANPFLKIVDKTGQEKVLKP
jgi:hypothetical protein